MRQDRQPYEHKPRAAILLIVILCLPLAVVTVIDGRSWRYTAPPLAVAAALIGVGTGLYTLLFLLLFYCLPRWIKARGGPEYARRWQYAALVAAICTVGITVVPTVLDCPIEPRGLAMGLAMLAALIAYTLLAWLMARHFPEACNWIPFRRRK